MNYSEKISRKLNEVLQKTYDAEQVYMNALDKVDCERLQSFFRESAFKKNEFARSLKKEIINLGGTPEDSGSLSGTLHRNWVNLKTAISSNNEEVILDEAFRVEMVTLEEYNELLKEKDLPPSIENLLIHQKNEIEASMNSVKLHEKLM